MLNTVAVGRLAWSLHRVGGDTRFMGLPEARCPIRPGDPCSLCQVNVTGPQDCGLVYLVMNDPELREGLARTRTERGGLRRERSEDPVSAGDRVS
jgi:hypothetical protein